MLVKNTFINFEDPRPPSLEGFFEDRQVRSCPASAIQTSSSSSSSNEAESECTPLVSGISLRTHDEDEEYTSCVAAEFALSQPPAINCTMPTSMMHCQAA